MFLGAVWEKDMVELADYLTEHDPNFRKARLPALYSDFQHQKSLNLDGYRANVCAWRGALARLASHGLLPPRDSSPSLLVLKVDTSLLQMLEHRQHGQPLALGTAISEATADQDLLPLQNFLSSSQSIYPRGRAHFSWNFITWPLRQLGIIDTATEDKLPVGQYVIMDNVRTASRALAERTANHISQLSRVFTKSQFREEFASNLIDHRQLSELDTTVLLTFLSREARKIEYDGQTIRFRRAGEPEGVTDEDAAMASIKELMTSLKHQIRLLTSRIDQTRQEVLTAVARKNRVTALATLKSKKLAESALTMRYATLNQLQEIAAKIEQASDQDQLVKILESSADLLHKHHARVGDADRLGGIMDRLREHMSGTDELSAILAEPMGDLFDEGEIDEELEALETEGRNRQNEVQQQREKKEDVEPEVVQQMLDSLPSIPASPEAPRMPASKTGMRTSS